MGIWGFGFNDGNHPWSPPARLDVITWFKGQGCYVMGGVPTYWRTGVNDSRPGYLDAYHAFNMISPRAHGDLMWRQFYNLVRLGAQGIYISMFDQYGESTGGVGRVAVSGSWPSRHGCRTNFSTVLGPAGYTFDPATGNTAARVFFSSGRVALRLRRRPRVGLARWLLAGVGGWFA